MKKNKIVIITLILGILFLTSFLYSSYATSTGVSLGNDENTYDILLNDSTDTVSVPAKSSKTIYYQFSNTNKGTVKYHIGYSSNNVIAKVWWDSEDFVSGTIDQGVTKFIKLKLINESTEDDTITIKPVLGYVNGGDVIPDSNTTLVTGTINETNTMSIVPSTALNTLGIAKSSIEEISFVNDNIVPSDALGSTTVSSDNSVMLWYTASDTEGMYKVYIGSNNGITSFPTNCRQLFNGFSNVVSIDFSYIDTSKVTSMHQFFRGCTKLENVSFENFNTTNVNDLSEFFYTCSSLNKVDLTSFETSKVTTMAQMFYQCTNLETIILGTFSNNVLYYVQSMFYGCSKLKNLDLIDFGTSRVINMNSMFRDCSYLRNINLSNFDTKNVTNMGSMFMNCTRLASVDVSNFNTSKVKMINYMFFGCYSLKNIDLSNFDTSIVTSMDHLFTNSTNLERVNLSNFNMSNVSNITEMFSHNKKLKSIDFSNVDFTSMSVYSKMLNDINNSAIIYVKDNTQKEWIETRFTTLTGVTAIDGS